MPVLQVGTHSSAPRATASHREAGRSEPGPAFHHLEEAVMQGVAAGTSPGLARPPGEMTSPKGGVKGCSVGT